MFLKLVQACSISKTRSINMSLKLVQACSISKTHSINVSLKLEQACSILKPPIYVQSAQIAWSQLLFQF